MSGRNAEFGVPADGQDRGQLHHQPGGRSSVLSSRVASVHTSSKAKKPDTSGQVTMGRR